MTRSRDVADTQDNSGGAVAPVVAGKNAVINGAFDIWQRGTSFTSASVYTADRWFKGSQSSWTTSRQTSGLTGFQYAMRFQRNSGNTSTVDCQMFYNIETIDALRFAGQTVTVSFYARAGANFSASASQFSYIVYTGTGTDQRRDQSTGYTGEAQAANSSTTITTSWQRFSFTATISSTATEIALALGYTPTGTAGANDYVDITGVQLEVGSVATPFSRNGGTIQGELAACQRYFQILGGDNVYEYFAIGASSGANESNGVVNLKTTMRVAPTLTFTTASNFRIVEGTGAGVACTTVQADIITKNTAGIQFVSTGNLTAYRANRMTANNTTSATIQFSSEL